VYRRNASATQPCATSCRVIASSKGGGTVRREAGLHSQFLHDGIIRSLSRRGLEKRLASPRPSRISCGASPVQSSTVVRLVSWPGTTVNDQIHLTGQAFLDLFRDRSSGHSSPAGSRYNS